MVDLRRHSEQDSGNERQKDGSQQKSKNNWESQDIGQIYKIKQTSEEEN